MVAPAPLYMGVLCTISRQPGSAGVFVRSFGAFVLCAALSMQAQEAASLRGTIHDVAGRPLAGVSIQLRAQEATPSQTVHTDVQGAYSFAALRETGECVIAIPAVELALKVVKVGNSSGGDIDKFKTFDLTPAPADRVAAPLVVECYANLECRIIDTGFTDKYDLFVLEVLKAWIDPKQKNPRTIHHRGNGTFVVDGVTIKLKSKMR